MKRFLTILLVALAFASAAHAQSCGGGIASYFIVDEDGMPVEGASISIRVVSENQAWLYDNFPKVGWKLQKFKSDEHFMAAYEIEKPTFDLLQRQRLEIINGDGIVDILGAEREALKDLPKTKDATFVSRTVEGCALMATAEVQAEGYHPSYYISTFTCDCDKSYKLRLVRKRERCLPSKPNAVPPISPQIKRPAR